MPPVVAAAAAAPMLFTAGATLGAGALTYAGAKSAGNAQKKSSQEAIAFAREQEANKMRMWEQQQAAAKAQWDTMQANLAPYRAARASVLQKYGINTDVAPPTMPEGFGMPGSPTVPGGAQTMIPQRRPMMGPQSQEPMNPMGPVPLGGERPQVNPIMLRNWSDWSNYLGQG